jgi:hypothetical protein
MNVVLSCLAGDIFLGSIDVTKNKKTKAHIATKLNKYTDSIGPDTMTQICMNNATNMLNAMDHIVMTYFHIFK